MNGRGPGTSKGPLEWRKEGSPFTLTVGGRLSERDVLGGGGCSKHFHEIDLEALEREVQSRKRAEKREGGEFAVHCGHLPLINPAGTRK